MGVAAPAPDPYEDWLQGQGINPGSEEERARFFELYVQDTTGWCGQQFSLSEDERHWITRANEIVEWASMYAASEQAEFLEPIVRLAREIRPMPKSLEIS